MGSFGFFVNKNKRHPQLDWGPKLKKKILSTSANQVQFENKPPRIAHSF
jgi:hypothetical protein